MRLRIVHNDFCYYVVEQHYEGLGWRFLKSAYTKWGAKRIVRKRFESVWKRDLIVAEISDEKPHGD